MRYKFICEACGDSCEITRSLDQRPDGCLAKDHAMPAEWRLMNPDLPPWVRYRSWIWDRERRRPLMCYSIDQDSGRTKVIDAFEDIPTAYDITNIYILEHTSAMDCEPFSAERLKRLVGTQVARAHLDEGEITYRVYVVDAMSNKLYNTDTNPQLYRVHLATGCWLTAEELMTDYMTLDGYPVANWIARPANDART